MSDTESTYEEDAKNVVQTSNDFAAHLHKKFSEAKGNVFFSPFYLSATMALVLGEAKARGQDYIDKGVGDVISAYQEQISTIMTNTEASTFKPAFSVFNRTGLELEELCKTVLTESFDAFFMDADSQDDLEELVEKMNEWVKEKTSGLVTKQMDALNPNIGLLFSSAVYFKGTWLHAFDKSLTTPENFYNNGLEDEAKSVDMMHMKGSLLFAEKELFQAIQLPFLGNEIAMLVLLPQNMEGLEPLEASFTRSILNDLIPDMSEKKVDLALPVLHLEYLQCMDYSNHPGSKNLLSAKKGLGDDNEYPDFLCEIMHKAVLDVDEGGEEVPDMNGSAEMFDEDCDLEFKVDHPFAFIIYDVQTNLIIFMGRVEEL